MTGAGVTLEGVALTKRFGGLAAVDGVSVRVDPGEVVALIGPNGAGKTTLFQCLTGGERPDSGAVVLDGRDVTRLQPDARARLGMGRTFQRLAVFPTMSVEDNLRVGAENRSHDSGLVRVGRLLLGMLGFPSVDDAGNDALVERTLTLLGLRPVRAAPTGALPTGTLRLVELGRALCHEPRVLLLDEPASGLDTTETVELQRVIRGIADDGVGVLLVEHDVDLVFDVADRVYAMAEGRLLAEGAPDAVRTHPAVREAYLDIEANG
jgi:branched-chain amino acid transport system ATP-binding protein